MCVHECARNMTWLCNTFSNTVNYTSDDQQQLLADVLKGEFCYIQRSDGRILFVHYGSSNDDDTINIKRSTFQVNIDSSTRDVEEIDAGSVHTSHYVYIRS